MKLGHFFLETYRSLNILNAKSVTPETVETYFQYLSEILEIYDIFSAPGLIYNIVESGFSPWTYPH